MGVTLLPPSLALALLLVAPRAGLGAQGSTRRPGPDSASVLKRARRAQADFERDRTSRLPYAAGRATGVCDERVGRFCFWYDEDEKPPAEPQRVARARDALVTTLEHAAAALPGDDWIVGQRVRYLVEARRATDAVSAARACLGTAWWCAALAGFAAHAAGEYRSADSAFARAMRGMPREESCRWRDISPLLDGGDWSARYRKSDCATRDAMAVRFWWLTQPLLSGGGNDARTEFFARHTMTRLQTEGTVPSALGRGADVRELVLRYGWPTAWARERAPAPAVDASVSVVGYEPTPSFDFRPSPAALQDPLAARASDWTPTAKRGRSRYAPAYASRFDSLPHEVAVFRRGDTALVVGAYDLSRDTAFAGKELDAALVLSHDERDSSAIARISDARERDPLLARAAPWGPVLMSLEVRSASTRAVARARYAVRMPLSTNVRLALSDLLLYSPSAAAAPRTLEEALPLARGSAGLRRGERLGLFWELYGLPPRGERISLTVSVSKVRASWLRRAARSLSHSRRATPVRIRWGETLVPRDGRAARALALDLSRLERGRYVVTLVVTPAAGGPPGTTAREIDVSGP